MQIILTNQHCDNRGDESATIGLVEQIYANFGKDTKIIMLKQTRDFSFLPEKYGVEERNMTYTMGFMFQAAIWIAAKFFKLDIRKMLTKKFRDFLTLHENSQLVLSSCGGPYIGDLYINHEIVHIFYVLIPELLGKPVCFTAPSMGPFHNAFMNPLRRSILNRAKLVVLRDKISFEYVKQFLHGDNKVKLAADACFANEISEKVSAENRKNMIGFTPLSYKYPDSSDPKKEREEYKKALVTLFDTLMEEDETLQVQFFPQLYNKHSDIELIQEFRKAMKYTERTVVFSENLSGVEQQKEIGNMKMMIATRYHSAVFSCKQWVPCVCIAYEHKAVAMMESFGLKACTIDIRTMTYQTLYDTYQYVKNNYQEIYKKQQQRLPEITAKAQDTIKWVKEVYDE